ncbi:MAG: helix-turn-helix transcriptional regulator [Thermomicrobiales bacterium]|nr:helix-turn-helix transcriptional regulator [Thermomicrobiales bacterium]
METTPSRGAELGPLLTRFRTERGLAQKEVARLAEIDGSTLSRLENGGRGVSRDVLDRIAAALQLDTVGRLSLHVAAGFLDSETARLLADPDLTALAAILTGQETDPRDVATLRLYVTLALEHATALGYRILPVQDGG